MPANSGFGVFPLSNLVNAVACDVSRPMIPIFIGVGSSERRVRDEMSGDSKADTAMIGASRKRNALRIAQLGNIRRKMIVMVQNSGRRGGIKGWDGSGWSIADGSLGPKERSESPAAALVRLCIAWPH